MGKGSASFISPDPDQKDRKRPDLDPQHCSLMQYKKHELFLFYRIFKFSWQ